MKKMWKAVLPVAVVGLMLVGCGGSKEKSDKDSVKTEEVEEVKTIAPFQELHQTAQLDGFIDGKYRIQMELEQTGNVVKGTYYYVSDDGKRKKSSALNLQGTIDEDGHLDINETNQDGMPTGHFDGAYGRNTGYHGKFVNYQGDQMTFSVNVKDVQDLADNAEGRGFMLDEPTYSADSYSESGDDFEFEEDDSYSDDDDYSDSSDDSYGIDEDSSGSTDWDALLDEYEGYCDESIRLAKKVKAGDPSAYAEYADLVQKAQSVSSKLQNAKSQMTSAQMSRLATIANKMAKAAQEMR